MPRLVVELANPLVLSFLIFSGLIVLGCLLVSRVHGLLRQQTEDQSLVLVQRQLDQPRLQLSQSLDNGSQSIQQQLSQLVEHARSSYQNADPRLERLGQRLLAADSDQIERFESPPGIKSG